MNDFQDGLSISIRISSIISKITSSISISISLFNYLLSGEPILLKIRFGDMIVMNIEIVMGLFF